MRLLAVVATLLLSVARTLAAPTGNVQLKSLNSNPADDIFKRDCRKDDKCGIWTVGRNPPDGRRDRPFGEGICMPLPDDVKTVWVGHCFCSLWEECNNGLVSEMSMCGPFVFMSQLKKKPKYISCGGNGL